jgi:hypothetical protein
VAVPREVHVAAVQALVAGRLDGELLDLVRDSFLDAAAPGAVRTLVFGTGDPVVRVEVTYGPRVVKELTVAIDPPRQVEVEMCAPTAELHQVVSGPSPVALTTTRRGPGTLSLRDRSGGGVRRWRTAWVTF